MHVQPMVSFSVTDPCSITACLEAWLLLFGRCWPIFGQPFTSCVATGWGESGLCCTWPLSQLLRPLHSAVHDWGARTFAAPCSSHRTRPCSHSTSRNEPPTVFDTFVYFHRGWDWELTVSESQCCVFSLGPDDFCFQSHWLSREK